MPKLRKHFQQFGDCFAHKPVVPDFGHAPRRLRQFLNFLELDQEWSGQNAMPAWSASSTEAQPKGHRLVSEAHDARHALSNELPDQPRAGASGARWAVAGKCLKIVTKVRNKLDMPLLRPTLVNTI